jgi:hypothetical protein
MNRLAILALTAVPSFALTMTQTKTGTASAWFPGNSGGIFGSSYDFEKLPAQAVLHRVDISFVALVTAETFSQNLFETELPTWVEAGISSSLNFEFLWAFAGAFAATFHEFTLPPLGSHSTRDELALSTSYTISDPAFFNYFKGDGTVPLLVTHFGLGGHPFGGSQFSTVEMVRVVYTYTEAVPDTVHTLGLLCLSLAGLGLVRKIYGP